MKLIGSENGFVASGVRFQVTTWLWQKIDNIHDDGGETIGISY